MQICMASTPPPASTKRRRQIEEEERRRVPGRRGGTWDWGVGGFPGDSSVWLRWDPSRDLLFYYFLRSSSCSASIRCKGLAFLYFPLVYVQFCLDLCLLGIVFSLVLLLGRSYCVRARVAAATVVSSSPIEVDENMSLQEQVNLASKNTCSLFVF